MGEVKNNRLTYISDIRILVTLVVIFYHSSELYIDDNCGVGFPRIPLYEHLDVFIGLFQMPMFVFISGFLFGLQAAKGKFESFGQLLTKKAQRILLPLVVFALAYYLIIPRVILDNVIWYNSVGHLWFLEMLFECFLLQWMLRRLKAWKQLLIAVAMTVISTKMPLVICLNSLGIYFVYFNAAFLFAFYCNGLNNSNFRWLLGGGVKYCFVPS